VLTVRTELTDRILIFGERHLRRVLAIYAAVRGRDGGPRPRPVGRRAGHRRAGEVDDVGSLDEPLTVLLAMFVGASAALTLSMGRRRWPGWLTRHSTAAGVMVLVVGLAATTGAAVAQAFSSTGDCAQATVDDRCGTRHPASRARAHELRIKLSRRSRFCR
jgi:hypothetical protein